MNRRCALVFQAVPIVLAILFPVLPSSAAAQMTVTGESLTIQRVSPPLGIRFRMDLRFRVEGTGDRIPIAFSVVEATRDPDPARPTVPSRQYDIAAAPHRVSIDVPRPDPTPAEVCFNVYAHFTGTGLRSALLVQNACWGATPRTGTGQRIELKPDLTITIDALSIDRTVELLAHGEMFHPLDISFTVRNVGTAPTGISTCWSFSYHLPRAVVALPPGWSEPDMDRCAPIPAGGSLSFLRHYQVSAAVDRVRVTTDPLNHLREIREDNNTDERLIGVPPRIRGTEPVKPDIRRK